ncbi:MAG: hypothetical protein JSU65_10035, partial [Candidatus Zixiibacteriota bacterium]
VEDESGSIDGVLGQIGLFSNSGNGVRGLANGGSSAVGVSGQANAASSISRGVFGAASGPSTNCVGVDGLANGGTNNYGLWGRSHESGSSITNYGVYSQAWGGDATNYGIYTMAEFGTTNYGIWAGISGSSGYAGYFDGDVHITGTLTGGGMSGGANGWVDDGATVRLETAGDEVGIGTSSPDAKLHVDASQIHAGRFESNTGMGDSAVLHAEFTGSGEMDAIAVYGSSTPADFWGIGGRFESNYIGVEGNALPLGTDPSYAYIGAVGSASGGNARNYGVRGSASNCAQATGVYGGASGGTEFATGVTGAVGNNSSLSTGVMGSASGSGQFNHGVSGVATGSSANFNYGVFGQGHSSPNGNIGVYGSAVENYGWKRGVYGSASGTGDNYGLYGFANDGDATTNYGVYASAANATTNYAGYFQGDVTITGTLTGGSPSMRIDHPEDPDDMYLQHASVVSPDMMTVYNGNIVTDSDNRAVVTLPGYFETLNGDFRYQLTVIGSFARAIVLEEIKDNRFIVATDQPNVKVSWQVTGIRRDPYAMAERLQTEIVKAAPEQGKYQHPGLYGAETERAIGAAEPLPVSEQIDEIVRKHAKIFQKR